MSREDERRQQARLQEVRQRQIYEDQRLKQVHIDQMFKDQRRKQEHIDQLYKDQRRKQESSRQTYRPFTWVSPSSHTTAPTSYSAGRPAKPEVQKKGVGEQIQDFLEGATLTAACLGIAYVAYKAWDVSSAQPANPLPHAPPQPYAGVSVAAQSAGATRTNASQIIYRCRQCGQRNKGPVERKKEFICRKCHTPYVS